MRPETVWFTSEAMASFLSNTSSRVYCGTLERKASMR